MNLPNCVLRQSLPPVSIAPACGIAGTGTGGGGAGAVRNLNLFFAAGTIH